MAKTPVRLSGPGQLAGTATTLFTASGKQVIRHIHIYNPSTATTVTMSIGTDAAGTRILDAYSVPEDVPVDIWGPFTLEDSEVFQASAAAASQVVVTIDGETVT